MLPGLLAVTGSCLRLSCPVGWGVAGGLFVASSAVSCGAQHRSRWSLHRVAARWWWTASSWCADLAASPSPPPPPRKSALQEIKLEYYLHEELLANKQPAKYSISSAMDPAAAAPPASPAAPTTA